MLRIDLVVFAGLASVSLSVLVMGALSRLSLVLALVSLSFSLFLLVFFFVGFSSLVGADDDSPIL